MHRKSSLLHQKKSSNTALCYPRRTSSSDACTGRVLHISVGIFGALERRDCLLSCIIECFIVALLWRFGREMVMVMLNLCASARSNQDSPRQKLSPSGVGDFYSRNQNRGRIMEP
jgi:divalent metal cation (Fe/Co/Zn/Cd) transporter